MASPFHQKGVPPFLMIRPHIHPALSSLTFGASYPYATPPAFGSFSIQKSAFFRNPP